MAARKISQSGSSQPSRRKRVLIVDGHSIIFAWPELRQLHEENTASAREALMQWLTQYQDASDYKVVLVFDGRGARAASEKAPQGIQVFYSDANRTADDLVERLVAKYAEVYDITVATRDNLERQTVVSLGAFCIDADQLQDRMDAGRRDVRRHISKLNNRNRRWNRPGKNWPG
jgi:hypothetical protein